MKYEIFINGGFANIPKQYVGEISLDDSEKKELFETLSKKSKPSNTIYDGFIYHVRIMEGSTDLKAVFDEHNLPESIQKLLNEAPKN